MRQRGLSCECAADGRSEQIDPALVHAHEADDFTVLADRADRGSDKRPGQEHIKRARAQHRDGECDQAREADAHVCDFHHREPHADIAEIRAEQQRRDALQEEQQPARSEQLVDCRRTENGRDDELVDQHA